MESYTDKSGHRCHTDKDLRRDPGLHKELERSLFAWSVLSGKIRKEHEQGPGTSGFGFPAPACIRSAESIADGRSTPESQI